MSDKITLPSGALLDITLMPYEQAWEICQIVTKFFENVKLDVGSLNVKDFLASDLISISGPVCKILSSKELVEAGRRCFARCTIDGIKIASDSFEKKESRADFIPTIFYALRENISPFFENLLSSLKKN